MHLSGGMMSPIRNGFSLVVWLALTGLIALVPAPADAQQRVRAAYIGLSGSQVPFWLAIDLGLFKKHGLDVEAVHIRGGALATTALIADEVQFVAAQGFTNIVSALQGHDVTILATYYNRNPYSFVTVPRITRPSEVVGKKIGLLSIGSVNSLVAEFALKHWGIDESKVVMLRAGATRERVQAMMAGHLDATVAPIEELRRMREAGLNVLLDIGKINPFLPMASISGRRNLPAAKRPMVKQFLRGMSEGVIAFKNNKERSLKTLSQWARIPDRETLEDYYLAYYQTLSTPPKTEGQGVQSILDFLAKSQPKAKGARAQDFIDENALSELQAEGFFEKLGS
jgi:ABC-type nitrate/sulfonate/bicarbonate transport system substrate-binding protein